MLQTMKMTKDQTSTITVHKIIYLPYKVAKKTKRNSIMCCLQDIYILTK